MISHSFSIQYIQPNSSQKNLLEEAAKKGALFDEKKWDFTHAIYLYFGEKLIQAYLYGCMIDKEKVQPKDLREKNLSTFCLVALKDQGIVSLESMEFSASLEALQEKIEKLWNNHVSSQILSEERKKDPSLSDVDENPFYRDYSTSSVF